MSDETTKSKRAKPFVVQRLVNPEEDALQAFWVDVPIVNGMQSTEAVKRAIKDYVAENDNEIGRYRILQVKDEVNVATEQSLRVSFV